jgi:hypothetical protein
LIRQEAVVLSYLEWVRLINTGGIRLDERRIARWSPKGLESTEIVAELMLSAPDLGSSANAFVLAVLEPEVLDRVRANGVDLGKRLPIEMVSSFHSFTETARTVHGHDAEAAGVEIALTPLAQGWLRWVENVHAADRQARGATLLQLLSLSPGDWLDGSSEWIEAQEGRIDYEKIARWRDTMYYGWSCALNSVNARPGVDLKIPAEVKGELLHLQKDYNVDQPFLAAAPLLRKFVETLANETEAPLDLFAFAALKQHERYVAKREGAALDLESLYADMDFLKEHDIGAANMLARVLGERLPAELLRALKVSMTRRNVIESVSENDADDSSLTETEPGRANVATGEAGAERKIDSGVETEPTKGTALTVDTDSDQGNTGLAGSAEDSQTHDSEGLIFDGAVNHGPATPAFTADPKSEKNRLPTVAEDADLGRPSPSESTLNKSQPNNVEETQTSLFDGPEDVSSSEKSSGEADVARTTSDSTSAQPSSKPSRPRRIEKYARLQKYFQGLPSSPKPVKFNFAEIEKILGTTLPATARKDRSWWSNNEIKAQSKAWIDAGFKKIDLKFADTDEEAWVKFERII